MPASQISIALCTFNGERFLRQQLESLARQTLPPLEVIACDDASTDATVHILQQFSRQSPFPVQVHVNAETVGPAANFDQAVGKCRGQIIAFCDQDDIWVDHKLATIQNNFASDANLGMVFSDAQVCDEAGQPLGYRLWDSLHFPHRLRRAAANGRAFEAILRQNIVSGATMAIASRYRPLVFPTDTNWLHDGWIALLISAVGKVAVIPEPLIFYRRHPRQMVGATKRSLYQQYLDAKHMDHEIFDRQVSMYAAVQARLRQPMADQIPAQSLAQIAEKIRHVRTRAAIRNRQCSRITHSFIELATLRYRRYSLGWKSFAQDLLL